MDVPGRTLAALALAACITPATVPCGDKLCPVGAVCTPRGCASQDAFDACEGKLDGEPCMTNAIENGICADRACYESECGDGLIAVDEVCDDGNTIAGDLCSADCRSLELCGNESIDLSTGEQCDEGAYGLGGDGCSSVCQLEVASWRDITPHPIAARSGFGMAHDAERAVIVLFGGATATTPLGDTWIWDDVRWTQLDPLTSPSPRVGPAMAYDKQRNETILFGGLGEQGLLDDTWRWDGKTWQQLSPPQSPSARHYAVMAWAGDTMLMHGGDGLRDTWTWDGTTWTKVADTVETVTDSLYRPALSELDAAAVLYGAPIWEQGAMTYLWGGVWQGYPSNVLPLNSVMMAYDGSRQRLIMFGGRYDQQMLDETYETESLSSWTMIDTTASKPLGRIDGGLEYYAAVDKMVLFGGFTKDGLLNDTWTFQSGTWAQRMIPPTSPPPRASAALVYDTTRGRAVLFGGWGYNVGSCSGDTWIWNTRSWQNITSANAPARRFDHAMAYDSARDVVVLYGGHDCQYRLGDTWELSGLIWTQRTFATYPYNRVGHALAYDAARATTVMFGGHIGSGMTAETWTYDGVAWTQKTPATSPSARLAHALAYDPVRERVVLFGGETTAGFTGDTWEWDGTTWTERTPAASPPPRMDHTLAYDAQRQRIVLVGGRRYATLLGDVWEWDGTTWTELATRPPSRADHASTFDAISRQMIVYGGQSFAGTPTDDAWGLSYGDPNRRAERCRSASDDFDGDGLAGCADPDCWGRCTPLCAPGMSCGASAPRCGDGTCSLVEDGDLCPADC